MKIYDRVKYILEKFPQTRDSDKVLLWWVWQDANFADAYTITKAAFFSAPSAESITRARRKVQEEFPHLQATKQVQEARKQKEATKGTFAYREELPKGQTSLV